MAISEPGVWGASVFSRRGFLAAIPGLAPALNGTPAPLLRGAGREADIECICKSAWEAGPVQGALVPHVVRRLTVHHSGRPLRDNRRAPARFRAHQSYHQSLGWPDIAYHFLIDRHGNTYKGRPTWARGDTSTDYDPSGHLLVLCEGNFGKQPVSPSQVRALVRVLAWASRKFDVDSGTIRGHRDFASTACPGADLYRLIASGRLEHRVRKRLRRGDTSKKELCGRAGRRRVAAIERGDA